MNDIQKKEEQSIESTKGNVFRTPLADILENDNEFVIWFDVPGVEKDDLKLEVEKDVLTLSAGCSKQADEGYRCIRDEMVYSGFRRSFDLGRKIDSTRISADYKNGTLKLVLPKREEQKTRQIQIKVG